MKGLTFEESQKDYWYTVLIHSQYFILLSSPPSGQDGRTSMLLEQRARGGFTRMLWCTNNSERPVDALAENGKLLTHNLKSRDASASKNLLHT